MVKNPPAMQETWFDPWIGKILRRRECNSLWYSCLENPMDRGAWWVIVHWVAESDTTEVTEYAHMSRSLSLRTPYPICLHPFPT